MTAPVHPLVAERVDSTRWYSGISLVESVSDLADGIESGTWIDVTIGGVATSMDALGTVVDPLGSLVSWGVGWLIEHVEPLSDALDQLAGDPDQVAASAATWRNVAANTIGTAAELRDAVHREVGDWAGPAAEAYRARVGEQLTAMSGIARAADTVGSLVEASGLLVALVREMVRDLIADFVSVLVVRLPEWIAETGLTFGAASPLVATQVTSLVAKWAAKIAKLLLALVASLRRLAPVLRRLGDLIEELRTLLRRGPGGGPDGPGPATRDLDQDGTPDGLDPDGDGDGRYDDFDGDGRPDVPPPITGGPPLPTKPMDDHYRYETDPAHPEYPFPGHSTAVQRLTPEDLETKRVFVGADGLLYKSDGTLFDTRGSETFWGGKNSEWAIFVMDEHGNLYASTYQAPADFHHSTLANGGPVAGAGEIRVIDGRFEGLTDQSGHYRPGRSMTEQVVERLRSQGLTVDPDQVTINSFLP